MSQVRRILQLAIALSLLCVHPLCAQNAPAAANQQEQDTAPPEGVYRVGGGVTAPRAIYAPNPEYTDKARKAKTNGTVVVSLIVTPEGKAQNVQVTKSLTPDLDQKAIEAVRKWRFKPATKDGQPVAVRISAEATFRLY
jgi:TonB family protein